MPSTIEPKPNLYKHYTLHTAEWLWPNFTAKGLSCRCCGEYYHDPKALNALQLLRERRGVPIFVNSAHRCPAHNRAVGGHPRSRHLTIAFDCACSEESQAEFIVLARLAGFTGIGQYKTFVHLDLGPAKEWRGTKV